MLALELGVVACLIVLNGFFAMAELALVSSRRPRLSAMAEKGSTGEGVRDHLRHLGPFQFEDLGEQQVKNIARPVRAFRVMLIRPTCPSRVKAQPSQMTCQWERSIISGPRSNRRPVAGKTSPLRAAG